MPMQGLKRACPSDCSSIMGDSPTSLNAVSCCRVSHHRYRDGTVRDGRPIPRRPLSCSRRRSPPSSRPRLGETSHPRGGERRMGVRRMSKRQERQTSTLRSDRATSPTRKHVSVAAPHDLLFLRTFERGLQFLYSVLYPFRNYRVRFRLSPLSFLGDVLHVRKRGM
jgi:hypothetical protein